MENEQASLSSWAKIEVMGRQSHTGFAKTEAYGSAVLFRVDVPSLPEREFILEEGSYCEHEGKNIWMPAGTKVRRPATEGHTVLVGAGSIYRIIPCTEAAAMRAIELETRSRLKLVEAPPDKALSAGAEIPEDDGSDEDGDEDPFE